MFFKAEHTNGKLVKRNHIDHEKITETYEQGVLVKRSVEYLGSSAEKKTVFKTYKGVPQTTGEQVTDKIPT